MQPQDHFVSARKAEWNELDAVLIRAPALHRLPPSTISRVAALYRSVCSDLMHARSAGYETELLAHLDRIAAGAHNLLYGARPVRLAALGAFVIRDFPRTLRAHASIPSKSQPPRRCDATGPSAAAGSRPGAARGSSFAGVELTQAAGRDSRVDRSLHDDAGVA